MHRVENERKPWKKSEKGEPLESEIKKKVKL